MRRPWAVVLLVLAGCGTTSVLTEHWKVTRERTPTANGGYTETEVGERGAETKTRIVVAAPKALNLILGFLTPGGLGGIATVLTAGAGIVAALRGRKYKAATASAAEYADDLEKVIAEGPDSSAKVLATEAKAKVRDRNKPIQAFVQKARGKT